MKKRLRVVNLIPTYNEAENVVLMLEALEKVARENPEYDWATLIVDDNSPDGTGRKVKSERLKIKSYKLHLLEGKKEGLGVALVRGYQYALGKLKADVVVSNDCDFLFDPFDIPKLLEKIDGGFDVVVGSRHSENGIQVVGWPLGRYLTHWVANYIFATTIAGTGEVHDHNGNFRAIRVHRVLDRVDWDSVPTKGYGFLNYMIYELSRHTNKFAEVQVKLKWRERGESKVSFNPKYFRTFVRDTVEYIRTCFWIRWDRMVSRNIAKA